MMDLVRRVLNLRAYARGMGRRVEPERQPVDLERWAGLWVAIKDGAVIAAAPSSRELVPMVKEQGDAGKAAVARYVPVRSDDIVIGVG